MIEITAAQMSVFVATLSAAILSPGPGVIAVSQGAFALGRRRALVYGWGLAIGASVWCLVALLGLTALFRAAPWTLILLRLAGGAFLLRIGWSMWAHARDPMPDAARARMSWTSGAVLNLSNPKPALFYSAVLLSIFPPVLGPADKGVIYAVALSVELFFYTALASLMALPALRRGYAASKFWIDRGAGLAIALLGLSLILRP